MTEQTRKPDWTAVETLLRSAIAGIRADSTTARALGGAADSARALAGGADKPTQEVMAKVVSGARHIAADEQLALPPWYDQLVAHVRNPEAPLPSVEPAERFHVGDLAPPAEGDPVPLTLA